MQEEEPLQNRIEKNIFHDISQLFQKFQDSNQIYITQGVHCVLGCEETVS